MAIDADSLVFIKTKNTGSNHIEVHVATAASSYQSAGGHWASWFSAGDSDNGTWAMVGDDLYFIKTKNTGSGHIEVHVATAASGYQSAGGHWASWFSAGDADNGTWSMAGKDLYFIKTKNTASGHIEVHDSAAASGYQSAGGHWASWFSAGDADNGTWTMAGKNLYFIKTRNTGSGHIEVHMAPASGGYQSLGGNWSWASWFSAGDADNGTWTMVGPDLYFIKTKNGGSGHIEVHVATATSGYQSAGGHWASWFSAEDADNGTWTIGIRAPQVSTASAVEITQTSATLVSGVDPGGAMTFYHFEYGTTIDYGHVIPIPDGDINPGPVTLRVTSQVTGLQPNTTHHFRLVAANAAGTTVGSDATFRTQAVDEAMEWQVPPPPQPAPGDPAPAPVWGTPLNLSARSGLLSLAPASPTDAPWPQSGAAIAAAWTGACAGGDRYPNNCAHFLSNALIGGGYSELLDYGARCPPARRPLRARELNQWFITKSSTMPLGRTSRELQRGTGWWLVFQLNEAVYWGGHVALLDSDNWLYYGTGWYGRWDQYLYTW